MTGTDARGRADDPAMPEPVAPGWAGHTGVVLPARGGGHGGGGPAASGLGVTGLGVAGYRRRRRGWIAVVVVVVVVAAGVAGADAAGVFRSPAAAVSNSGYATGTAPVTRGSLIEQTQEDGTLGDAGSYTVVVPGGSPGSAGPAASSGSGTFTWLPAVGQTIRLGQQVYRCPGSRWCCCTGTCPPTGICRRG